MKNKYIIIKEKKHIIINRKSSIFNTLPVEIINLIFSNIKTKDLYKLKVVCFYWFTIIEKMINIRLNMKIEKLHISDKRRMYTVDMFKYWYISEFNLYRITENNLGYRIIEDEEIMNRIVYLRNIYDDANEKFCTIKREFNYVNILNYLKDIVKYKYICLCYYDPNEPKCDNPEEAVWKTIIGITGLDFSLEELEKKSYDNEFVQSFMNNYKWYYFDTDGPGTWAVGIIAVYPDNKTFSVLNSGTEI
jgi:F-box-like